MGKKGCSINLTRRQNPMWQLNDFPSAMEMIVQSDALMNHILKMNAISGLMD